MIDILVDHLGGGDRDAGFQAIADLTAARRIAEPGEIANAILYLASERASFVTGAVHLVDGGLTAR